MSKKCSFVKFPNHPLRKFRQPCNTELMKSVIGSKDGKVFLNPKKVYCLASIKDQLECLLRSPGFKELLHKGPTPAADGVFTDMCDGNVYKNFKDNNGLLYFDEKRNIGFLQNVDWFNPYKNRTY